MSDLGRVRSLPRKTLGRWGTLKTSPGRMLKPEVHKLGYLRVNLCRDGRKQHALVHRLVAQAFLPPIAGKPCVNHRDSTRANNVATNLEWCTYKENTQHAIDNDRLVAPRGARSGTAKLKDADVIAMRALRANGVSYQKIADAYAVDYRTSWNAVNSLTWRHVRDAQHQRLQQLTKEAGNE